MPFFYSLPQGAETIAAIDLGSNSFHMIVARLDSGQLHVIDRLREMVRLGAGLGPDKRLDEATAQRALGCLERFGQRLRDLPSTAVRAVGTNTLRQVRDPAFLRRAEQALGHPIEVIAGREEARLVYLGVAHGLDTGDNTRLVIDIGGGSTELIIGQGFETRRRESLHMGCVSYSRFFPDGEISRNNMSRAMLAGRLEARPVKHAFETGHWEVAIGSSGSIKAIRDVVQAAGWCDGGISREALKLLRNRLIEIGHSDKLALDGLSSERAPVFAGGVAVLSALFKALGIEFMQVSDQALREGLLYEMLGQMRHTDVRERTINTLIQRYNVDQAQAERVAATSGKLLAQVAEDWQLADQEAHELLNWAARLHEIGLLISHSSFHKHGEYILGNADLSGFSRQQQHLLAVLVRGHRRKFPLAAFEYLPEELRQGMIRLCVLLRLAVLLHRSRSETERPPIRLQASDEGLHLRFPDGWLERHPLTIEELQAEAERLTPAGIALSFE